MKIIYVANVRMPTEKAHGLQIVKTIEALVEKGAEVELVVPKRANHISETPQEYYSLTGNFAITYLPVIDTVSWGRVGFFLESLSFAWATKKLLQVRNPDIVYGRDEVVLAALVFLGVPRLVWESHTGAWNSATRFLARKLKGLVVLTEGSRDFYRGKGMSPEKMCVAPDGVDLDLFENPESKENARTRLGLPLNAKIALYIGKLDGWKGMETLYEAATLLPSHIRVVVIGGEENHLRTLTQQHPRVTFLGARPYREIADNQAAADVLVLPNTGRSDISMRHTSPLKLFTYMASGIPMIVSDLPSIREIVDETLAFFVPADDPRALATTVERVLEFEDKGHTKAEHARAQVRSYTWDARAQKILGHLSHL